VTEWRRGAVSLVASMVLGDEEAHRSVRAVLDGEIAQRDPGLSAAMIAGLPRVVEMEPDRAEDIVEKMADTNRYDVAIKMADLFARTRDEGFASPARSRFRDFLSEAGRSQGPLERSLASRALRVLSGHQEG